MKRLITAAVLSALAVAGVAQEQQWHWGYSADRTNLYAATENDAGSALGQYCWPQSGECYYLLGIDASCDTGTDYPSLVNTEHSAFQVDLYCSHTFQGRHIYIVGDFEKFDEAVRRSLTIGIAIPMQSGHFQVNRFTLNGSERSIDAMHNASSTYRPGAPTPSPGGTMLPPKERI